MYYFNVIQIKLFLEIAIYLDYYYYLIVLNYKTTNLKAIKHYQPENLGEEDWNLDWELDIN